MAIPPIPRPATSAVTLTPRLSRTTTIRDREQGNADQHSDDGNRVLLPERPAPSPRSCGSITPKIISRAQITPCRANAMVKAMSTSRSILCRKLGVGRDDVERGNDHEKHRWSWQDTPDDAAPANAVGIATGQLATEPSQGEHEERRWPRRRASPIGSSARLARTSGSRRPRPRGWCRKLLPPLSELACEPNCR